jgi:hypothetical protein
MKMRILLGSILILLLIVLVSSKSQIGSNKSEKKGVPTEQAQESQDGKLWVPKSIEKCVAQVNVGEPIETAASINPFYMRANFDGNDSVDYAVLVQGQKTKKRGLIICMDSREPSVFGAVSKSTNKVTSFQDDNFVTGNWEIVTKEETRNISWNTGKNRIGDSAKGESIAFVFDGGELIIYWDGKTFQFLQGT